MVAVCEGYLFNLSGAFMEWMCKKTTVDVWVWFALVIVKAGEVKFAVKIHFDSSHQ